MRCRAFCTMLALLGGGASCAYECVAAGCYDVVHLTLRLPSDETSYTVRVETEAGSSTCVLRVPLSDRGERCADEMIVRWQRLDGTSARLALFDTSSVGLTVETEEGVVLREAIELQSEDFITQAGTEEYCGGPCGQAQLTREVAATSSEPR